MKIYQMASAVVILAIITSASIARAGDVCSTPVTTEQGPVIGLAAPDEPVCAYKGIPYAAPPTGELRFAPPAPALPRSEPLEAFEYGEPCLQIKGGATRAKLGGTATEGSEDCLFLNVWRPAEEGSYPVMFWIHGGGLIGGKGSNPGYDGSRMAAREKVVLVTINYRLGAFGFLAHPGLEDSDGSVGNYGLLDQVAALQWVKHNIAAFGGDPDRVTIFGESAGGWSVCNLLAAPPAAGLFERAIIESGGCDTTKTREEAYDYGKKFAAAAGCPGDDAAACLRALPPNKVLKVSLESFDESKGVSGLLHFPWVPVEDGHALKGKPIESLKSGDFNRTPIMVGANRDEAKLFAFLIPGIRWLPRRAADRMVEDVAGPAFLSVYHKYYPYSNYRRPMDAAVNLLGDLSLLCKSLDTARAASPYTPVYLYRFDYDDHRAPHLLGAAHGLEIPLVFGNFDKGEFKPLYSRAEIKRARPLSNAMMGYWTSFGRTGDPNRDGLLPWPAFTNDAMSTMILDLPQKVEPADCVDKCREIRADEYRLY